ncbi:MAG TPA: FAD-binding oxidoreductase [Anaerolineales bacterium]|jgi:glycine/D-amino acid oxidase-like deaminating enzyme
MIKERVFWHDTVEMPSDTQLAALPERVDIAIIGGGYTGLSAALTLAKLGAKVAVLEAETVGWGASSRNGGMTLTGLKVGMSQIIKDYSKETAKKLFQTSLDSIDTVEQIIKDEEIACGFARTGHLNLATKPAQFDELARSAEFMQKEFNHSVRLVSKIELAGEVGSQIYYGGAIDEISGGLNPAQYVTGLARAAERAGAVLCARARVISMERKTKGYILATARGELTAGQVLVATSGYTGNFFPWLQKKIIPVGSFIIATGPLSVELAAEVSPKNRMIFDSRHYLNYYRLSTDNRMVFGGRAAFFPESAATIRQSAEILRREMVTTFPQLRNTPVDYAWGGTLDFTFDMMPHVGGQDGLFYSIGYAGHGVALATHLGKTTGQAILDGTVSQLPFARLPFPGAPLGLYNGRPWFLPFAGLWYRLLDLIE